MKHLLTTVALLVVISGCDGSTGSEVVDVPDGGSKATDAETAKSDALPTSIPSQVQGSTATGFWGDAGTNPCPAKYASVNAPSVGGTHTYAAWYPTTGLCYPGSAPGVQQGVCGVMPQGGYFTTGIKTPVCGTTYAPGTLLIWDNADIRFDYFGNPSGGLICLPNNTPYVVPC